MLLISGKNNNDSVNTFLLRAPHVKMILKIHLKRTNLWNTDSEVEAHYNIEKTTHRWP